MGNETEDKRVCAFCGVAFEVQPYQKIQVKSKWPTHCSRSCARSHQHAINNKNIRIEKTCPICGKNFITVNWNSDKTFCSNVCASTNRFGVTDRANTKEKLGLILKDEKYMRYLKNIAKRISFRYRRGDQFAEDILQEYFLELSRGVNTLIEHVAKNMIRKELKRGITGKWDCDFSFHGEMALAQIKQDYNQFDSVTFVENMIDVFKSLNTFERKFILLYLKGFTNNQIMERIRKEFPVGNERFYREKEKILNKCWSNFGDTYGTKKVYK